MTAPVADGVMAATYKLVQQAMSGQWSDVPRTVEERRALLDQLSAAAMPQDRHWLSALQQAIRESDAAVARMAAAAAPASDPGARPAATRPDARPDSVTCVMNMIGSAQGETGG